MKSKRRNILAAGGILGLSLSIGGLQRALAAGRVPLLQGINKISGQVSVNGKAAAIGQILLEGDTISTGPDSEVLFVIGDNVFLARARSVVRIESTTLAKLAFRLTTGALASVFGRGEHKLHSSTATVGIRGTAVYLDSNVQQTYFCLCYGGALVSTEGRPGEVTELVSRYHDSPFYIGTDGILRPAPVIDHTDAELVLLEGVVGRRPPFMADTTRTGY